MHLPCSEVAWTACGRARGTGARRRERGLAEAADKVNVQVDELQRALGLHVVERMPAGEIISPELLQTPLTAELQPARSGHKRVST